MFFLREVICLFYLYRSFSFSLRVFSYFIMDGRRTCKGCGAVVVKPITCPGCSIASHPTCLARSGHPHSGGLFLDCKSLDVITNQDLLDSIRSLIRSEFANFRKQMLELCQVYIVTIINDIQCISDRIDKIEAKIVSDMSSVHPLQHEENIIEELADRNRRSNNLIFYNLKESSAGSFEKNKKIDSNLAIDILQCIVPDKVPISKVIRIGNRSQGRSRPLCVTLPSKEDAISILRKKNRYSRPVRIYPK